MVRVRFAPSPTGYLHIGAARIFREVRAALAEHPELQRDREKLMQVCCATQLPVQLRRAPKPLGLAA